MNVVMGMVLNDFLAEQILCDDDVDDDDDYDGCDCGVDCGIDCGGAAMWRTAGVAFLPHDLQDDKCVAFSPWYQQQNPTNSSLQFEPYIAFPYHDCT